MHAGYELLEGDARKQHVSHVGCCEACGFMETGLIAWKRSKDSEPSVICKECFVQEISARNDCKAVYLPEMPEAAFSHYVRGLAFVCFAALTNNLGHHDFSTGRLPEGFDEEKTWSSSLKFKTLKSAINDPRHPKSTWFPCKRAQDAYGFIKIRLKFTEQKHGTTNWAALAQKIGEEEIRRNYRAMVPTIPTDRIRSWGNPGSTFHLISQNSK